MTENDLREAVKDVERYFGIDGNIKNLNGLKVLLDLATSYLEIKGWTEKKSLMLDGEIRGWSFESGRLNGFNEALSLYKLALIKRCSEENLMGAMLEYSQDSIDPEYIKGLATAIRTYLLEEK